MDASSSNKSPIINIIDQMNLTTDPLTQKFPYACLNFKTDQALHTLENYIHLFGCSVQLDGTSSSWIVQTKELREGAHQEQTVILFVLGLTLQKKFPDLRCYLYQKNPIYELLNETTHVPFYHTKANHSEFLSNWINSDSLFRIDVSCSYPLHFAGFAIQITEKHLDLEASKLDLFYQEVSLPKISKSTLKMVVNS